MNDKTIAQTIFDPTLPKASQDSFQKIDQMWEQIRLAVGLVARLRGPQGCPWDREQNHLTLRPYLIEEAYEVLDVLDTYQSHQDPKALAKRTSSDEFVPADGALPSDQKELLKEELGDLLLQVLLHSQLCAERGDFHFGDVSEFMARKLVSRHPHVFGETKVQGSEQVLTNWEILKKKEKPEKKSGLLASLPRNLPSLQRAARIGEKAKNVGFDWPNIDGVWAKVEEEMGELKQAIAKGDQTEIENELGDLFFSLCNFARWKKIQPEDAHRKSIERFESRFSLVEQAFAARNQNMHEASLADLDAEWERAKSKLRQERLDQK